MNYDATLWQKLHALLEAGGIEDAEVEARWIIEDAADAQQAQAIAQARAARQPLQYLLGAWEFYGLKMFVGPGVLIPRADTETLVDAVLSRYRAVSGDRLLDLCCGSGCVAIALQTHLENAVVSGMDVSPDALQYARKNAQLHTPDMKLHCANVLDAAAAAQFHGLAVITCNPPYLTADDMANLQEEVTYEPALALAGGTDGLHFYREITRLWRHTLKAGGMLAYEVGAGQADAAAEILSENGFTAVEKIRDLNGIERVVLGIWNLAENASQL